MKKILGLLIVFILVFGIFSFVSASINNVEEILPIEEDPELCTSSDYTYSVWSACIDHTQARTLTNQPNCIGGIDPVIERNCPFGQEDPLEPIDIDVEINTPPTILFIENDTKNEGDAVVLTAVPRDVDHDVLSCNWRLPAGINVADAANSCTIHFTAPNVSEHTPYEICVRAYDGEDYSGYKCMSLRIQNKCTAEDYQLSGVWSACINGQQTMEWIRKSDDSICVEVDPVPAPEPQSCGGNTGGGGGSMILPIYQPIVPEVLGEKIGEDRWIKTPNSSTVYMLDDNNIRHAYPHEKIWYSYFDKDFSFVETITEEQLTSYTLGKNVQFKAGSLIKIPSVPKVYLVGENFLIQWIKTEDTAIRLYGADWNKLVYDLDEAFFDDYVLGGDIE